MVIINNNMFVSYSSYYVSKNQSQSPKKYNIKN